MGRWCTGHIKYSTTYKKASLRVCTCVCTNPYSTGEAYRLYSSQRLSWSRADTSSRVTAPAGQATGNEKTTVLCAGALRSAQQTHMHLTADTHAPHIKHNHNPHSNATIIKHILLVGALFLSRLFPSSCKHRPFIIMSAQQARHKPITSGFMTQGSEGMCCCRKRVRGSLASPRTVRT